MESLDLPLSLSGCRILLLHLHLLLHFYHLHTCSFSPCYTPPPHPPTLFPDRLDRESWERISHCWVHCWCMCVWVWVGDGVRMCVGEVVCVYVGVRVCVWVRVCVCGLYFTASSSSSFSFILHLIWVQVLSSERAPH